MRRPRIVHDWKSRLRDYSSAGIAGALFLQGTWLTLTDQYKAQLDPAVRWALTSGVMWVLIAAAVGKFVVQGSSSEKR